MDQFPRKDQLSDRDPLGQKEVSDKSYNWDLNKSQVA